MACQENILNTLLYRSNVMGLGVQHTRYRSCHEAPELITDLLSACSICAVSIYIQIPIFPYVHEDIMSVDSEKARIYWSYSFSTLRLLHANQPDVVHLYYQKRLIYIFEFSVPAETNVSRNEKKE